MAGHGGKRPGAGAPPLKPTDQQRAQIATFVGLGLAPTAIAGLMRMKTETLRKHFRYELETGTAAANAAVAGALFKNATDNMNVTAQIWWTKARMGWKDTSDVNVNNSGDPTVLHLLAVQAISEQLARERADKAIEPPTLNGVAEHVEAEDNGDWRNAPPPKE